jgi:hypothetical protein
MAQFTVYRYSDTSAPALSGTAGALVTVLDAVLVNGYGSKAAAGWTKPYSGTNQASYRLGAGTQFYLNVDDNGPGAGTGKEARIRGYETMTAYATGTNLFPTAAQLSNGIFVRKSASLDTVTRAWVIFADARTMYMFVLTGDSANTYLGWMFGDFYSYKSADVYNCLIFGRKTENSATLSTSADETDCMRVLSTTKGAHYVARDNAGGLSPAANIVGDAFAKSTNVTSDLNADSSVHGWAGDIAMTNPADTRVYIAPMRVVTTTTGNSIRGRLRGFWHWCHPASSTSDGDTFSGDSGGDLAGRSFINIKSLGQGGVATMETSATIDTN